MRLEITNYEIKAGLPEPICFAYISDVHEAPSRPIIDAVESISPDAVLLGGDIFHNRSRHQKGLELITELAKRYPVFSCLGNHERLIPDVRDVIRNTGTTLLDDSSTEFRGVTLGGFTSLYLKEEDGYNLDWIREFGKMKGFKILLCHHPEYYDKYVKDCGVDITLSGHAHGGQWRVFGRGIFSSGQGLFPKYTHGRYGALIVGRGIGNQVIVPRINNIGEIAVLKVY